MAFKSLILAIAIMAVLSSRSHASDPSPLQDFCVAVDDSKNAVSPVNVNNLLGLNTLDISLARIDYAPYGLNPRTRILEELSFLLSLREHSMLVLSYQTLVQI
ncbi:hypothetical protein RDI58_003011 [Solanum bulbocastanum]|uniref:Cupin type-1 domain-containing protein n=1 Tax=Solanum bulbocastanum TaxID=147425 RepID=A0AAN8UGP2_SOLBU